MKETVFVIRCWNDAATILDNVVWRFRVVSEVEKEPQYFATLTETMTFIEDQLSDRDGHTELELKD